MITSSETARALYDAIQAVTPMFSARYYTATFLDVFLLPHCSTSHFDYVAPAAEPSCSQSLKPDTVLTFRIGRQQVVNVPLTRASGSGRRDKQTSQAKKEKSLMFKIDWP